MLAFRPNLKNLKYPHNNHKLFNFIVIIIVIHQLINNKILIKWLNKWLKEIKKMIWLNLREWLRKLISLCRIMEGRYTKLGRMYFKWLIKCMILTIILLIKSLGILIGTDFLYIIILTFYQLLNYFFILHFKYFLTSYLSIFQYHLRQISSFKPVFCNVTIKKIYKYKNLIYFI